MYKRTNILNSSLGVLATRSSLSLFLRPASPIRPNKLKRPYLLDHYLQQLTLEELNEHFKEEENRIRGKILGLQAQHSYDAMLLFLEPLKKINEEIERRKSKRHNDYIIPY